MLRPAQGLLARSIGAFVLGLWCLLALAQGQATHASPLVALRAAETLPLPQATLAPPQTQAIGPNRNGWRVVALPDDWALTRPGHDGAAWYRIEFNPPPLPAGELLALLIPRACQNAEIWLNGSRLERDGQIRLPYTRNCYTPQLVVLPSGLLADRDNRLEIQLVGHPLQRVAARQRAAGLSEMVIGPQHLLRPIHERLLFWNVTAAQIVAVVLAAVGIFMAGLGWVRGKADLQLFGFCAIGWSAMSARVWWREIDLPNEWVEAIICVGLVPIGVCGILFLLRYAGRERSPREALLWGQCLLAPLALWVAGPSHMFSVASAIYTLLAAQLAAAAGVYMLNAWREQRSGRWLMSSVLLLMTLAVAVEVAVQNRLMPMPPVHLIHFAMPLLFCALAFSLTQSYMQAMHNAERAETGLEQRVATARQEIEQSYALLSEQRAEQTAEKERKRIAADLHDDLGAKLLTIVHTSNDDRISTLAREALEEMRLSVRGLTGRPMPLDDALADWRAETVSRLGEANIGVDWSSDELVAPRMLSARGYVQTTRILREAVSNMIKHSGASQCTVRCAVDADLQMVIRDNGRGVPMQFDGKLDRGHGMHSMKHRAKQLQGQCLVESGPGYGTVIRLTIPL